VGCPDLPGSRYVDLDGPVHYVEWQGPDERTFVLVHGLGGAALNWSLVGPSLSRLGRVLAVDLAGFGRTPRAGRSSRLSANRALLSRFIDEVAGRPVVIAGNSMGGAIAMLQAAYDPASVEGLVLTGSVFPWAPGGIPSPVVIAGFAMYRVPFVGEFIMRQRFHRLPAEQVVRMGFRLATADHTRVPEEFVRAHVDLLLERERDRDVGPALLEAARSLLRLGEHRGFARSVVAAVECSTLVVHGRSDRLVPAAFALAAAEEHPDWMLRILPRVGHLPMIEAPERWLAAVEAWVERPY
jgi:pimeloyl-ACP methyl ester carboxylesterase